MYTHLNPAREGKEKGKGRWKVGRTKLEQKNSNVEEKGSEGTGKERKVRS